MSVLDTLITDRTQEDVDRVRELRNKGLAGTWTDDEKAEYLSSMKGAYNYTDLNRVGEAVAYIAEEMEGLTDELTEYSEEKGFGGIIPDLPFDTPVDVSPKTDWTVKDKPSDAQVQTYFGNLTTLKSIFSVSGDLPTNLDNMNYTGANNIEAIFAPIYQAFLATKQELFDKLDNAYLTPPQLADSLGGTQYIYDAATTIGNYALFAGGLMSGANLMQTACYSVDGSLTGSTQTGLSVARYQLAATTVGDYALFAGGYRGSTRLSVVDAYDESLTRTTITSMSVARANFAATTVGDYAIFAGGESATNDYGDYVCEFSMDVYDTSLTLVRSEMILTNERYGLAAATVGNYAIFAGGYNESYTTPYSVAVAFDESLTHHSVNELSNARYQLAATTVGNYALFAGGYLATGRITGVVDAYDDSLTQTAGLIMSSGKAEEAATAVDGYALFGGGRYNVTTSTQSTTDSVYLFNESLTGGNTSSLSSARYGRCAATVGKYALFSGTYTDAYARQFTLG